MVQVVLVILIDRTTWYSLIQSKSEDQSNRFINGFWILGYIHVGKHVSGNGFPLAEAGNGFHTMSTRTPGGVLVLIGETISARGAWGAKP